MALGLFLLREDDDANDRRKEKEFVMALVSLCDSSTLMGYRH